MADLLVCVLVGVLEDLLDLGEDTVVLDEVTGEALEVALRSLGSASEYESMECLIRGFTIAVFSSSLSTSSGGVSAGSASSARRAMPPRTPEGATESEVLEAPDAVDGVLVVEGVQQELVQPPEC